MRERGHDRPISGTEAPFLARHQIEFADFGA
jgi:hypothetical protein